MVILELHCDIKLYKKNTLASIFNWLVAWKRGLPIKFYLKIYPNQPLCNIPLWVFLWHKSHWGSWSLRVFIDRVVFRFHSDRALFRFLIDRTLFRVVSNMVFIEYSVKGSSAGSAVIDSSLGSSVLFFPPWC